MKLADTEIIKILSYRFGKNLVEPYSRFEGTFENDGTFVCEQFRIANYAPNAGVTKRTVYKTMKFKLKDYVKGVKNAHPKY